MPSRRWSETDRDRVQVAEKVDLNGTKSVSNCLSVELERRKVRRSKDLTMKCGRGIWDKNQDGSELDSSHWSKNRHERRSFLERHLPSAHIDSSSLFLT